MGIEGAEGAGGVRVLSGDMSECPGSKNEMGWGNRWVRISLSWCDEGVAVEGVKRLGVAVERWRKGVRSKGEGDVGGIK